MRELLIACMTICVASYGARAQGDAAARFDGTAQEDIRTPRSKIANAIKTGTPKATVTRLLGTATWATVPTNRGPFALPSPDIALGLLWRNDPCSQIKFDFDRNMRVIGIDAGFVCVPGFKFPTPPDSMLCSVESRKHLCVDAQR